MEITLKRNLKFILGVAIIAGIVRVFIDYISRLSELSPLIYYLTFFVAFILEIIIIVYVLKKIKTIQGGTIKLYDSLKVGVIIMGIVGLFYCIMAYIYDVKIDPDFQKNMTIRFTQQFSPEKTTMVKESLANQNKNASYLGVIMYTIWFVFLGATISLIANPILNKKE